MIEKIIELINKYFDNKQWNTDCKIVTDQSKWAGINLYNKSNLLICEDHIYIDDKEGTIFSEGYNNTNLNEVLAKIIFYIENSIIENEKLSILKKFLDEQ